jgi:Arabinose efflux permease
MDTTSILDTKLYQKVVLILGLAGFVSAADNWFISPSLPAIAANFGTTVAVTGSILTAYMIPYGFMQPIYGFFGDQQDKVKLLRVIVMGLAVGTAGSALSHSLLILCILRMITGFSAAGIIALSISIIGNTVPPKEQQIYVGKFMGIVFAGQGLSSGLGGILTRYVSWRGAFLFFAVIAIAAALLLQKLPAIPRKTGKKNGNFIIQCKLALFSPKGRVIFPLTLVIGILLLGIYGYLGSFLNERIGLDYMQSGCVIMFYGFSCLIGGSRIGKLAVRYGRKKIILFGEGLALISTVLLFCSFQISNWPLAMVATIFLGFGYISIQSTLATMALDVIGESKGLPSGLIGFGLFCGGGVGSMLGGRMLLNGTYQTIWLVFGICILLLIPITKKLKLE